MIFPLWANPANNPSKTEARWISPEGVMNWATTAATGRYPVPPGGGNLRKLKVQLGAAPGSGKSWTFSYVVNGEEITSTRVKIEGSNTKGEWKGTLELKEGDTFQIQILGAGEPANPEMGTSGTALYTIVETAGNTFWIAGGGAGNLGTAAASYNPPFGINNAGWQGTEGLSRIIVPGSFKLKGVAVDLSGVPGGGASYALFARVNRAEDVLEAKINAAGTSALATGTVAMKAGEALETKVVPAASPTARSCRYTYSIETEVAGEMFAAGMNEAADSKEAAQATYPDTYKAAWNASTTNRVPRPTGLKFERLYVEIGTAPGALKSRTYAMTLNGATQTLSAVVEGAAKSGNDTTHSFTTDGTSISMLATPALVPETNTGGVHWGFVVIVPQPVDMEAAGSGSGTMITDFRALAALASDASGAGTSIIAAAGVTNIAAQVEAQGAGVVLLQLIASMSPALSGEGALGAELAEVVSLSSTLAGIGTLSADFRALAALSAELGGEGILSAELKALATLAIALNASGQLIAELEALVHIVADMEAAFYGDGDLNIDLAPLAAATGSLEGLGAVVAAFGRRYTVPGNAALTDVALQNAAVVDRPVLSEEV